MSQQTREDYMREAIKAAKEAQQEGGVAIGAVLVHEQSGNIVSTGGSIVALTNDPTAHAEVNCIRVATKDLESDNLTDYTLYSTLEPCHMCLSAAAWARIPRVYFGAYRKDVDASLFDVSGAYSDEDEAKRMNLRDEHHMTAQGGILESECVQLLNHYHDTKRHKTNGSENE